MFKVKIFFIIIYFILTNSEVFAQRLILGFNQRDVGFYKTNENSNSGSAGEQVDQCGYDDVCLEHSQPANISPTIFTEFSPFYFGKTNLGIHFGVTPYTVLQTKLINFPKDNESIKMTIVSGNFYTGLFYTWGNKDLGKNGKWSFRLGFHGSYIDNYIFYDYLGKTYQTRFQDTGGGLFVTWDWSDFCFIMRYNQGDKFQKLDDSIKDETNSRIKIKTDDLEIILAYSYYFN